MRRAAARVSAGGRSTSETARARPEMTSRTIAAWCPAGPRVASAWPGSRGGRQRGGGPGQQREPDGGAGAVARGQHGGQRGAAAGPAGPPGGQRGRRRVAERGPDAPGPVVARAAEHRDRARVQRERRVQGPHPPPPEPGLEPGAECGGERGVRSGPGRARGRRMRDIGDRFRGVRGGGGGRADGHVSFTGFVSSVGGIGVTSASRGRRAAVDGPGPRTGVGPAPLRGGGTSPRRGGVGCVS